MSTETVETKELRNSIWSAPDKNTLISILNYLDNIKNRIPIKRYNMLTDLALYSLARKTEES